MRKRRDDLKHYNRLLDWLVVVSALLLSVGCFEVTAAAMQGGGGEEMPRLLKRPSNPEVRRRPKTKVVTRSVNNRRAASVDPKPDLADQVEDAIERGNSERDAKNYSQAEEQYQKARTLDPKDSRAYYGLGNIYYDQERFSEAVAFYKDAIRLKPDDVASYSQLADAYNELEEHDL